MVRSRGARRFAASPPNCTAAHCPLQALAIKISAREAEERAAAEALLAAQQLQALNQPGEREGEAGPPARGAAPWLRGRPTRPLA